MGCAHETAEIIGENMKKKHNFHLKNQHIFVIFTIVCVSLLAATFSSDISVQPLKDGAGYIVIPFEKGINTIGNWINDFGNNFKDVRKLAEENSRLHDEVESLKEQNVQLARGQKELERLEKLYKVDEDYNQYPKVLAQVIAKEPGNWYSTFTINKVRKDGIKKDMNVLADGGLVGLVIETGPRWATVRTIIDDSSNVSAMTLADSNTCIVSGSLELIDSGKMQFSQLRDDKGSVTAGENIITSHISDKYLNGILIGTISSITRDANNLTSTGYLVPAVDFRNLQEVLVITTLKEQAKENDNEK